MIGYKQITTTSFVLTEEGGMIVKNGSHEYRVWEVLPAQGGVAMGIPDLKVGLFLALRHFSSWRCEG
jgi:phenylalanyl-tRNA synthetase alpha chain